MYISRQVGNTSEVVPVFIQDATVSTGAGLANIVASSVSFSWKRNNQAAVSSGTCTSTGTLGTYGVSTFTQQSSTTALGWYDFCPPDGVFTSGGSANIHLYGAPSMAPCPILIELTKTNNQQYVSSQVYSSTNVFLALTNPVGVSSFSALAGVSTVTDKGGYGVSSVTDKSAYGVSSVTNLNPALLDVSVSSRAATADTRFAFLDVSVSSRSTFSPTAAMTESYRADGATGSHAQLMYEIVGHMGEVNIDATTSTKTLYKLDGSTSSMLFQLNSSTAPTAITRIA